MAPSTPPTPAAEPEASSTASPQQQQLQQGSPQVEAAVVASTPLELSDLSAREPGQTSPREEHKPLPTPTMDPQTDSHIQSTATQTSFTTDDTAPAPPRDFRKESEAIGPAIDAPSVQLDPSSGPAVMITLLLPTGARHPFKIDERYLRKRNVTVDGMNPLNISVYTMKELIWRDWREEWEPRPTSPSYIRLIFFGSMLDDKSALKECKFNAEAPNVVHMTVKPQEILEDEDVKQAGKHGRRGSESERTGFRCCVIL